MSLSAATLQQRVSRRSDLLGAWAALICALHCALMPAAVAAVPALGLSLAGSADFDQAFVIAGGLLGVFSLGVGFRLHRRWRAAGWLALALTVLVWGAFGPLHQHGAWHAATMVGGGVLLGLAHLCNLRDSVRRA